MALEIPFSKAFILDFFMKIPYNADCKAKSLYNYPEDESNGKRSRIGTVDRYLRSLFD